jgi:hypothetical protein
MALSRDEKLARLRDPDYRAGCAMRSSIPIAMRMQGSTLPPPRWEVVFVDEVADPRHARSLRRTIAEIAAEQGVAPADAMLDLALAENLATRFRFENRTPAWEQSVRESMKHPSILIGVSDGGAHLDRDDGAEWSSHFLRFWVLGPRRLDARGRDPPAHAGARGARGLRGPRRAAARLCRGPVRIRSASIGPGTKRRVTDLPGGERFFAQPNGIAATIVNGEPIVLDGKLTGALPDRSCDRREQVSRSEPKASEVHQGGARRMGRFGHYVIDADGHGGEPLGWRTRIDDRHRAKMREYVARMKAHYTGLPGGGVRADTTLRARGDRRRSVRDRRTRSRGHVRPGCAARRHGPRGHRRRRCSIRRARERVGDGRRRVRGPRCAGTLNDARAEFASHAPDRIKMVAKLPMIEPKLAAEELERCVTEHWLRRARHRDPQSATRTSTIRPSTWYGRPRSGSTWPVCAHGGGQAPGQTPFAIERFATRLGIHAITHPVARCTRCTSFTVAGSCTASRACASASWRPATGWLPFWIDGSTSTGRRCPEQAPAIDRPPSDYFRGRC